MSIQPERFMMHTVIASRNLETVIEDHDERSRAAIVLASCALFDVSRRMAFRARYAQLTDREQGYIAGSEYPTDPLAGAIIDLHENVALQLDTRQKSGLWTGNVSVELAATTQLGDWTKGGGLDEELRELPDSTLLENNGLAFTNTYNDPSSALVGYRYANYEGQLLARRTRAAGDITHLDETEIHVVKQSQFVLDETSLSTIATAEARKTAMKYEDVLRSKEVAVSDTELERDVQLAALKRRMAEIGLDMIEPSVKNVSKRNKSVLPVSSQYFALLRPSDN